MSVTAIPMDLARCPGADLRRPSQRNLGAGPLTGSIRAWLDEARAGGSVLPRRRPGPRPDRAAVTTFANSCLTIAEATLCGIVGAIIGGGIAGYYWAVLMTHTRWPLPSALSSERSSLLSWTVTRGFGGGHLKACANLSPPVNLRVLSSAVVCALQPPPKQRDEKIGSSSSPRPSLPSRTPTAGSAHRCR